MQPPVFVSTDSYGSRLGDVAYWQPYAEAALASSGLSEPTMRSGFVGTFPTLVGDRLVVKLFGYVSGWREASAAESGVNRAIEMVDGISAPRIVARGSLFPDNDDEWPFLVMERLNGQAWRDAKLDARTAASVARQLGSQIRRLHDVGSADLHLGRDDWIAAHGDDAAERHRTWGSLPERLLDEIPAYLGSYQADARCLVHGDLTEDHLFVGESVLLGIIDWGDAMTTDPFYELGALHLGAFAGDRQLLGHFLAGYGWQLDGAFADHALQVALMHEFDLFASFSDLSERCSTLAVLAKKLWTPIT